MAANLRRGLKAGELIAHLTSKGIYFDVITKADAEELLLCDVNYIRIAALRSLYQKDRQGLYQVSFDELYCLYKLDGRLRELLLPLCLELELALRQLCLMQFYSKGEDGYENMYAYKENLGTGRARKFQDALEHASQMNEDYFVAAQFGKYEDEYPIWIALEGMDFGTLIDFYEFCFGYCHKNVPLDVEALHKVRILRNMCAHNSPLLPSFGYLAEEVRPQISLMAEACADLLYLLEMSSKQRSAPVTNKKQEALLDIFSRLSQAHAKASYSYHTNNLELELPSRLKAQFAYIYKKAARS